MNKLPINPESYDEEATLKPGRFPSWLHRQLPKGEALFSTEGILEKYRLNTVCEEAKCPNRFTCYSHKTATFLALGKECTRSCGFCSIDFSKTPRQPEADEPLRIALSAKELGLKHVVITMVARDDLTDGGAAHMADIIRTIREQCEGVSIEVLTSDFAGNETALDLLLQAKPDVFNHNIETVRRLSPRVRHKATYERTLHVLRYATANGNAPFIKSGLMIGLSETPEEVEETLRDLQAAGCTIITIGQYLQSSARKLRVQAFIHPDQFKAYETYGYSLGITRMYCGPFVRSSFSAHEVFNSCTSL